MGIGSVALLLVLQAPLRPSDPVDHAVARAVRFLLSVQRGDGSITEQPGNRVAMTSLSLLALAATGHQPTDDSPAGQGMRRALDYVLRTEHQDARGFLGAADGSRMYGHGITTLMLSEMLGMGLDAQMDETLRDRCRKGIDLILKAQSSSKDDRNAGGWRYLPESRDSDLSISVWQVMALRSAKNAGFEIPGQAIERAVGYLKRCYKVKRGPDGRPLTVTTSACAYEPGQNPEYAMAAAGLLALQVCGEYDAPEVLGSADWLRDRPVEWTSEWFFYGTYYYAQGMYQRGGDYADKARKAVEGVVLEQQSPDGSWLGHHGQERGAGRVYCTAMGVLALAVKYHYLPIYQR